MSDEVAAALAQDLEEALVALYAQDAEMFDADAIAAVDALVAIWHGNVALPSAENLSAWAFVAYEALRGVCETYLGRDLPIDIDQVTVDPGAPASLTPNDLLSAEKTITVLRQLRQSIVHWQAHAGLRGFYESIRM